MTYKMNVAGLTRDLPLCPLNASLMIAAFVIFGDVELTCACAKALLEKTPEFDYMVAPEAKSIPLIHEMARQSGRNDYFLVRKAPKLYMRRRLQDLGQASAHSVRCDHHRRLSGCGGKSGQPGRRHRGRTHGHPGRRRRR